MSEQPHQEAMDRLLLQGAVSYLDALYALHRFRREASSVALTIVRARIQELTSALGIPGCKPGDVRPYFNPDGVGYDYDGDQAWVAAGFFLDPCNSYFYLGLSFERDKLGNKAIPYVTSLFKAFRAPAYKKLKSILSQNQKRYWDSDRDWECGSCWELENPLAMQEELQRMIDDVIRIWTDVGGWNQAAAGGNPS